MSRSPLAPRVVTTSQAEVICFMASRAMVRINSEDTGGLFTVLELNEAPGAGVPPHVHHAEDEVFHIIEGRASFYVDGKTIEVGPGTTLFGPRDVAHGYQVQGQETLKMLVTVYPAGIEKMFRELAALPPGPPDMKKIGDICQRYHIDFV